MQMILPTQPSGINEVTLNLLEGTQWDVMVGIK